MQKILKEAAFEALGKKNIFSESVISNYYAMSSYSHKEDFVAMLQAGKVITFATSPEEDLPNGVTHRRRSQYRQLRLEQLREFEKQVDGCMKNYCRMLIAFHDGSTILEGDKFRAMINRTELKLLKLLNTDEVCKCDIRKFLIITMLFADKHFLYSIEDQKAYIELCKKL